MFVLNNCGRKVRRKTKTYPNKVESLCLCGQVYSCEAVKPTRNLTTKKKTTNNATAAMAVLNTTDFNIIDICHSS